MSHAPGLLRILALAYAALAAGCATLPPEAHIRRVSSSAVLASKDTALGRIAADSLPAPGLTGFRLLPTGSLALDARLMLARREQATLDVQYYLLQNDDTGRAVMRALRDAGQRGVRVRLLVDDLYTYDSDDLLLALAATPDVEVRLFNPFPARGAILPKYLASLADFKRLNHRMHNKLFVADGAVAVAGGRNVANEYFMRHGMPTSSTGTRSSPASWCRSCSSCSTTTGQALSSIRCRRS